MKIDSAVQKFVESYDREALDSIEQISQDFGLKVQEATIPVFDITESFNKFCEYLHGYASYKVKHLNNGDASPQTAICEATDRFIDTQLFTETKVPYAELPQFVRGYIEGVNKLLGVVEEVKDSMRKANVHIEAVGDVNTFVDHFMESLDSKFTPAMTNILWASGYTGRKRFRDINNGMRSKKEAQVTFI